MVRPSAACHRSRYSAPTWAPNQGVAHGALVKQLEQTALLNRPGQMDLLQQLAAGAVGPKLNGFRLHIPELVFKPRQVAPDGADVTVGLVAVGAGHGGLPALLRGVAFCYGGPSTGSGRTETPIVRDEFVEPLEVSLPAVFQFIPENVGKTRTLR